MSLTSTDSTSELFRIPEDFSQQVPCQVSPRLFDDTALEIDIDESEWLALDGKQQAAYVQAKQAAEQRAIAACNTCPLLESCRDWALSTEIEIFGVVGGTTPEQRNPSSKNTIITANNLPSKQTKSERDALIIDMLEAGVPNKDIALRASCSVRTVERRKAELKASTPMDGNNDDYSMVDNTNAILDSGRATRIARSNSFGEADNRLIPNRVSPETAFIFDELSDGSVRSRESLLEMAKNIITREQALSTLPSGRNYDSDDEAYRAGARKFLMNRIDIAARRGRLILMRTESNDVLVSMDPETAQVWSRYRVQLGEK